jgi:hypothetical protein
MFEFHRQKAKAIKKKDQAQGQRQHSTEKIFLIQVLEEGRLLEERGSTPAKSFAKADVPSGNLLLFDSVHE